VNTGFEAQWKARFEEFAGASESDAGIAGWSPSGLDARVRRFMELWKCDPSAALWLDAGCGAGTYSRILANHGKSVVGTDYSLLTLVKARKRETDNVRYAQCDVRSLPFAACQFDGVLCFGVTQALSESESAIRELARVLRPGGRLWIDALNEWFVVHALTRFHRRLAGKPRHLRYESPQRIKWLLSRCGFVDIVVHWLPIAPASWSFVQGVLESRLFQHLLRGAPLMGRLVSHGFIVEGRLADQSSHHRDDMVADDER